MYARAALLLVAMAAPHALAEGIYTWKDDKGRVHFSDQSLSPKARAIAPAVAPASAINARDLVGSWGMEASRNGVVMRTTFTLAENGTFAGSATANGNPLMTYAGKWTLAGDRLEWLYTETSVPFPEEAKKDADRILSVSPARIEVLSLRSGEKRTLLRL